ncbi:hypothetical protein M3Y97_01166100 [Aphelenchoides bicaudatus]|nr:hypothetical protein M3Y97_01166100 [Aphelenchoides bicaudatus]
MLSYFSCAHKQESVDPKKRLNQYSRRCALEQALMIKRAGALPTKCFPKLLMTSKSFLIATKRDKIYRFGMFVEASHTKFCFATYGKAFSCPFSVTFTGACQLIQLLKPDTVLVLINLRTNKTSSFLALLPLFNGDLHFNFVPDCDVELMACLVKTFWDQIVMLHCRASALLPDFLVKKLDWLDVFKVQSTDQLQSIFRQKSKRLFLDLRQCNIDVTAQFTGSNYVEECEMYTSLDTVLPAVKFISKNFQLMKHVNLHCSYESANSEYKSTDTIVDDVVAMHDKYNQAMYELLQTPANVTFKVYAKYSGSSLFKLSKNWENDLMVRDSFQLIQKETTVEGDLVITTLAHEQKHLDIEGKFLVELRYKQSKHSTDTPVMRIVSQVFTQMWNRR